MYALVVVESIFGNSRAVAGAIATGLAPAMTVDVVDVGMAPSQLPADLDLLVVGGPTHAHGMSRRGTRVSATTKAHGAGGPVDVGIREWLAGLQARPALAAAAFDTRFGKPRWLVGSAARGAARRLRKLGFRLVAPPQSFFVVGSEGPLVPEALAAAAAWGKEIAAGTSPRHKGRVG
jgi:hypothetical protein